MIAYLLMQARRVLGLFVRSEPRFDEEIETHIALLAADLERRGLPPAAAATEARRQFGGVTQIRERVREQRRLALADSIGQDLACAFRQWRRSPLFAAAAIVTLALGIGATTAVFRALDAVALRDIPVADPGRLVRLEPLNQGRPAGPLSFPVFRELTAHPDLFAGAAAMGDDFPQSAAVTGRGPVKLEHARLVTGNYFRLLGVNCILGRAITEDDDRRDAPGVAVVGYEFWRDRLGGTADALGRALEIGNARAVIVGVVPRGFTGERVLFAPDVWLPMSLQPQLMNMDWAASPDMLFLDVIARLQPGIDIRRVQAVLGPQYRRLVAPRGEDNVAATLRVASAAHGIVIADIESNVERPLWVVMAAVALLLLIACCNLANLLLSRSVARTHEMGVRMTLGAGRGRLIRQLLTESLLLTAFGAAAGFALVAAPLLAQWGIMAGSDVQIDTSLNWEIFAFNAAVCAVVVLIFGLAPALAGSRFDVRSALQANRRSYTGVPRPFAGKALVVAQMAICLTVLSGAALLGRSLWNMLHQQFGFRDHSLLLVDMKMDWENAFAPETGAHFAAITPQMIERLNAIPGVRSAAVSFGGPLTNGGSNGPFSAEGLPPRAQDVGNTVAVSPGYFETMGIPLLAGRALTASDTAKSQPVAVISETTARALFGAANPLGRYMSPAPRFNRKEAWQIVGVSRDVRLSASNEKPGMLVFLPFAQQPFYFSSIALHTDRTAGELAPAVRAALAEIDPRLTVSSIRPVSEILDDLTGTPQELAELIGIFGGVALLLAGAGIFGVLAYEVQRRTPEIGIRIALGATREQVMGLVMGQVGRWLALGTAIGCATAACAWRALRSVLFGITACDSSLVAAAILALTLVAAAAAFLPARRAARLNIVEGLRAE